MNNYDISIKGFNKKRSSRKKKLINQEKMRKADFYDNLESAIFNIY